MFINKMKLKILVAAALMVCGVAHAGTSSTLTGDGSVANPYEFGLISSTPTVLLTGLTGSPGGFFEEYANFTIGSAGETSGSANVFTLNFGGINVSEITGLSIEVWDSVHALGNNLITTFPGDNATYSFGNPLAAGQYHLDISGNLGPTAYAGQYGVSISAVPEPGTYAMLLVGLGLVGFTLHRRKKA